MMPTARDPRWVLLLDNGGYSGLSRHREPDADDISAVEKALLQASRLGWLEVMSHIVYEGAIPELLMVRPLCDPKVPFDVAVRSFQQRLRPSQCLYGQDKET
jgi:hypothetical protein